MAMVARWFCIVLESTSQFAFLWNLPSRQCPQFGKRKKERIFHSLRALIIIPAFLPRSHLDQFEMCWLWTPSKVEHAPKLWLLYFSKGFTFLWIHHLGLGPKPLDWLDMCAICESENAKTDRMGKCVRETFKYCSADFFCQMGSPPPPPPCGQ